MRAFKLARHILTVLQKIRIPPKYQVFIHSIFKMWKTMDNFVI